MTHLSQATCARIAELMPDFKVDGMTLRNAPSGLALDFEDIISRDFLIAAFGDGNEVIPQPGDPTYYRFYDGTGMTLEMEPAWKHLGHRLLEVYWTSGVERVEGLLLELLKNR